MTKIVDINELENFVGEVTGTSEWFQVTQDQISLFADATHDHQFIHIDPERAADTMFGSTIAHGFLTLSMLSHLAIDCMITIPDPEMVINYGLDTVRFMSPVKVDKRIRAVCKLVDVQVKGAGKRALCKYDISIEIEGEKRPAMNAEWLMMFMAKKK
ncbi:MaoC family dehydratase [Temperatibacter marinus]|uniref:MaoC family dehydratase n=1 Tax=Temperatibacter marinus TaxID=1456591 RepID=A0AA52EBW2_9PROT|nr:MaoC family dehydratase [Temperatibacter marinus]WND01951.1 MaoC family dehydratase [Temperatibacter marinus]